MTLIELTISLVIFSFLLLALSFVSVQLIKMTLRSRNHLIAVREVQAVGTWISRDGQQSEPYYISTGADPVILRLGWDYSAPPYLLDSYRITYKLQDNKLIRDEIVGGVTTSSLVIAENIQSIKVSSGTYIEIEVEAATGGFESYPVKRTYTFQCRSVGA